MNQLHQDIKKANAQKLPTNYHLLLKELLCTRQLKIKFMLLAQYYKNYEEKKSWWSFRLTKIILLGWQAASTTVFIHHLHLTKMLQLWFNYANDTTLWLDCFPIMLHLFGIFMRREPHRSQTNTELDNSCYSSPGHTLHLSQSSDNATRLDYITGFSDSQFRKKNPNTFKGFV